MKDKVCSNSVNNYSDKKTEYLASLKEKCPDFVNSEMKWREKELDGIVDANLYSCSPMKVLFIEHEPWAKSEGEYKGQIQSIKEFGHNPTGSTSFSHGADIIKKLFKASSKEGCLERTAWINIKKTPRIGTSKEVCSDIQKAFAVNCEFLFHQIKDINPKIIIGGDILNGCHAFWNSWLYERNQNLRYVKINQPDISQRIYENNIDFFYESDTGLILVDIPHMSSYGNYGYSNKLPSIIDETIPLIRQNSFTLSEEWINRRDRIKARRKKNVI